MQMMKGKRLSIFLLSAIGIFIIILVYFLLDNFLISSKYQLTVYTLQPMGGATESGVHLAITNPSGHVISEKTTDAHGMAVFHLNKGEYAVTAEGGYAGQENFSLNNDLLLEMKVLSISH
jgi:hypothetical protein